MLEPHPRETGEILTVAQLNRDIRFTLEAGFACVWVEGEIADFKQPVSGHMYFTLKDEQLDSQIRCAMFRGKNRRLAFSPESGLKVLIRANVSVYEPRGDYQIIVEHMEESGLGALQLAFEALKKKLQREGLLDPQHKQSLPAYPQCVGVVTSPTGAAIRDILTTLKRRYPAIHVIIYPTLVQGDKAAKQICRAIEIANERQECDLLIVSRGGGSLEDLWPFNEEIVARTLFASKLPTVSAIGHEIDFTIADFVCDIRAATPTAAAEYVSPEWQAQVNELQRFRQRFMQAIQHLLQHTMQRVDFLAQRLQDPRQKLREAQLQLQQMWQALQFHMQQRLETMQHLLEQMVTKLQALSPLATLNRGYSITRLAASQTIIRSIKQVQPGENLTITVADGEIETSVINME